MNKKFFFPTAVYEESLKLDTNVLLNSILQLKEKDSKGLIKSNRNSYHSQDNLQTLDEFKEISNNIIDVVKQIFKEQAITTKFILGNMWANINPRAGFNAVHTHPNSFLSGVYYVKVPQNSGELRLMDPRVQNLILVPDREDNIPEEYCNQQDYIPSENKLLIFPSYVPHLVFANESRDLRVSISFNIILIF
jgi:uncharacterized protein (TIGR02466 family)